MWCIFIAGSSISSHISNITVRHCRMTNIKTGNFPTSIVGCTAIYAQWADNVLIENNYISEVSAFGIITEGTNYVTIRANTLNNTGWTSIASNAGDNYWVCDGNTVMGTDPGNRDEGGSIALNGTPSYGDGPTYNSIIKNNYITGSVSYGNGVRLGSVQNCEVSGNVFDQIYSGVSQVGGVFGTMISADTRNPQPFACSNLRIHHNIMIAPLNSLISPSVGGLVGITVENTDWSGGAGTVGRGSSIDISDNQFLSANYSQCFTQAVLVHGQTGGIDAINIHDNQGSGWCDHTANIPAFCAVVADGYSGIDGTQGTCTDVFIHHNRWENSTNVPGTVHVINSSTAITFSVPQTMAANDTIYFASQPGVAYFISANITNSTSGTLIVAYGGTTNIATTANVTNADQIGIYIVEYTQNAIVKDNIIGSWRTPYYTTGAGISGVQFDFNVMGFGAKGNGIADDTPAIQNAINAGGTVYFPSGTYIVSAILNVPSNVKLLGDSNTIIQVAASSTIPYVLYLDSVSNVGIQNLTIDVNKAARTSLNIPIGAFNGVLMTDCWVDHCTFMNATGTNSTGVA